MRKPAFRGLFSKAEKEAADTLTCSNFTVSNRGAGTGCLPGSRATRERDQNVLDAWQTVDNF